MLSRTERTHAWKHCLFVLAPCRRETPLGINFGQEYRPVYKTHDPLWRQFSSILSCTADIMKATVCTSSYIFSRTVPEERSVLIPAYIRETGRARFCTFEVSVVLHERRNLSIKSVCCPECLLRLYRLLLITFLTTLNSLYIVNGNPDTGEE